MKLFFYVSGFEISAEGFEDRDRVEKEEEIIFCFEGGCRSRCGEMKDLRRLDWEKKSMID